MNPSIKAAQKAIKKAGFAAVYTTGVTFKIYDEGKYCATLVDIKRSAHEDKLMLCVDKLSDMANNFRSVCDKLDGLVVTY